MLKPTQAMGTLTLMGSGELGPSMSKVHRSVANRLPGTVRPVFVNTPAGFEPNVHDIGVTAAQYVEKHLGVVCEIASFTGAGTTAGESEHALAVLQTANYIFAGPGSPSYAVRFWRGSPILELMARRLHEGAHVVCASAAAIALGAFALPVYEIFKAGADPHWIDGLDLLGPEGMRLAIVPHWNNTEGGAWDSSHCFMGTQRFERLESLLGADVVVLGIDEHTACTIDLAKGEFTVTGAGGVTVRRSGEERAFPAGSVCPVEELGAAIGAATGEAAGSKRPAADASRRDDAHERLVHETERARNSAGGKSPPTGAVALALAGAIEEGTEAGVEDDALISARTALIDYVRAWERSLAPDGSGSMREIAPLVDLLVQVRTQLRADGAWALSDTIRDGLASLGIALEDGKTGTTWRQGDA
jgi:cyanophycinase-like exopeptidase